MITYPPTAAPCDALMPGHQTDGGVVHMIDGNVRCGLTAGHAGRHVRPAVSWGEDGETIHIGEALAISAQA